MSLHSGCFHAPAGIWHFFLAGPTPVVGAQREYFNPTRLSQSLRVTTPLDTVAAVLLETMTIEDTVGEMKTHQ